MKELEFELQEKQQEIENINRRLEEERETVCGLERALEEVEREISKKQKEMEVALAAKDEAEAKQRECNAQLEKIIAKEATWKSRKEDAMAKLREIGTLPKEGYDKWKQKDQQSLLSMIERLTEKLKK